ncbi:MAG: AsnC family transcriptional regulator [Thermoproteota archaeon]|jgi:DNA-binding Lrp family transcriptional regulator|nr:AsnC family transcriptional regulator [Thermoproteota archaeon]
MPLQLDNYDVQILNSLLKDGRKSFREISRETGITTPTVKARFTRLVNVGFIKSVSPILNFELIEKESTLRPELEKEYSKGSENNNRAENENKKNNKLGLNWKQDSKFKLRKGLKIKMDCEFCGGPISADPYVFKFANYERFFCCTGCMSGYKQKYAGRIESIKRKFKENE